MEDRERVGKETKVINSDLECGRRWTWDKWLFEGNGLWAPARWLLPRRVPRCQRVRNTWQGQRRRSQEVGCAGAPVPPEGFRPTDPLWTFCPLLTPICGHFLAAFVPTLHQFPVCAVLRWRQKPAEASALSWKMGKQ